MTETFWQAVKRRHQNLKWARAGIDRWIDKNGTVYEGDDVDRFLNSETTHD